MLGAIMSPPQYPPKPSATTYNYKPRSATPDRLRDHMQNRPYRSGSDSLMHRPVSLPEPHHPLDRHPPPRLPESALFGPSTAQKDEAAERARRTSISGLLHRPESAPQRPAVNGHVPPSYVVSRPETAAPLSMANDPFAPPRQTIDRPVPFSNSYDTKPPPFNVRPPVAPVVPFKDSRIFDKRDSQSSSPELRRAQPAGVENRSFGSILNDGPASQNMARQDSVQSQNSAFGDRYRPRAFSPFAPSVASQTMSVTSMPAEEMARKGSDELSHRTILGLANESRRGRFSPVPQAVQGAQAQTPVPESGTKAEQGRIFAGLGGGLGSSTGPTSTPVGHSASPFKDGAARLSEENLMRMSRSTSGMGKRARKLDDEPRADSDVGDGKKGRKRSKYAHSYKVDLEDMTRRTPLTNNVQRNSTPNVTSQPTQSSHHHHHMPKADPKPLFKPKKNIKITPVITAAKRLPRRHLGMFRYDPDLRNADPSRPGQEKFEVSVRPNHLPSFDGDDHVNCTYTIRVPNLWLQERERRMICRENFLWGSGVYTDDSDVVAAAMHSGFIESVAPKSADKALLNKIIKDQNAKIEGLIDVPNKPYIPEQNKDAMITCVVLPALEEYAGSARFGVMSRDWPSQKPGADHDGVSFAIVKVEWVAGAVEARRVGRTGKERRQRLKQEFEDRQRSQQRMKEMVEKVKSRMRKVGKVQRTKNGATMRKEMAGKAALGSLKEKLRAEEDKKKELERQKTNAATAASTNGLDVGQAPSEWLKELESSAVEA
jgi:hypothetical protein